jgi:hypothetical protein
MRNFINTIRSLVRVLNSLWSIIDFNLFKINNLPKARSYEIMGFIMNPFDSSNYQISI